MTQTATVEVPAKGPSALMLALTVVGSVMLSALLLGGGAFLLARSGKLGMPASTATAGARPAVEKPSKPDETHVQTLEPVLVNLADPGGAAYLRIGVALAVVTDPNAGKEAKAVAGDDAAVRDVVLDVLGRQQSTQLMLPDGKAALKLQLLQALQNRVPRAGVKDIYFTDFLVQR